MGETFWQFRRYQSRRSRRPPSTGGNRRSRSICSCASANGKRRSGVVLARRLGRHALHVRLQLRQQDASARRVLALALASLLVRGGERIALLGDGRARRPARARCAASPMRWSIAPTRDRAAARRTGDARTRNSSGSAISCRRSTNRSDDAPAAPMPAAPAIWCRSSIRRKRIFPISGRMRFEAASARDERNPRPRRKRARAPIARALRAHARRWARWRGGWAGATRAIAPTGRRRRR